MKTRWLCALLLLLSVGLCGCSLKYCAPAHIRHLTVDQSEKNYAVYQKDLQETADRYGLEMREMNGEEKAAEAADRGFVIEVAPGAKISISFSNTATADGGSKGAERFCMDYSIAKTGSDEAFNVPLFVALVNCVSGRSISESYCSEFLQAPESKYAASRFGVQKLNGEIIAKQEPLNFGEDWVIFDEEYNDERVLSFWGLTKQLHE